MTINMIMMRVMDVENHWLEPVVSRASSKPSLLLTVVSNLDVKRIRSSSKESGEQEHAGKGVGGGVRESDIR